MLLWLLRAVYFLVKHRIPLTTVYPDLIEILVANGDKILGQHLNECPGNAQYTCTSRFTVNELVEAIDTWLENRLVQSLCSLANRLARRRGIIIDSETASSDEL